MSAISLKSITGITSITTPAGVDNQLTLHNNNTTEAVKLDIAGNLHFHNHLNITGISTAANFKTGTSNLHSTGLNIFDLDVDGHTNLDNVSIAGVTTITGALFADGFGTNGGEIGLTGTIPRINFTDSNANSDFRIKVDGGSFQIEDITNSSADRFTINSSGNVSINKDLDVNGHTNLDNVSIVGVTTITNIDALRLNHASGCYQTFSYNGTARGYVGTGNQMYTGGSTGDFGFAGGSSANIVFATANNERLRITSDGEILIGHDTSRDVFKETRVQISGANGDDAGLSIYSTESGNAGPNLILAHSRGGGAVTNNTVLGDITFVGHDGTDLNSRASVIRSTMTANGTDNSLYADLIFYTKRNAGGYPDESLRITSSGQVLIGETSVAGGSQKLVIGQGGAENFEFTPGVSTQNGGVLEYIHRGDGSTRPDLNMYVGGGAFKVYTNGNNQRLRIHLDGQSEFKADNSNSHFTVGNSSGTMTILDTTTPSAIGVGGRIVFGSTYYNAGSTVGGASIGSYKKEGPSNGVGEYRHYLNFHTRNENGIRERVRIDEIGHLSLRNELNSAREIQWWNEVGGSAKAASIGWGNGSANWEFKHFRNDNQADNPYANIDFFTGDWTTPTRALRITNDGNHIREKHTRFATRIDYSSQTEAAHVRLTFKSPHVNVGSDFSSSRYTAPVDGTYAFWFHTNVAKSGAGNYYATWYKNGSEVNSSVGGRIYDYYGGSGWNILAGSVMLNLQEGDYIEVYNGSQPVNYDGNSYGQFMGFLVG